MSNTKRSYMALKKNEIVFIFAKGGGMVQQINTIHPDFPFSVQLSPSEGDFLEKIKKCLKEGFVVVDESEYV